MDLAKIGREAKKEYPSQYRKYSDEEVGRAIMAKKGLLPAAVQGRALLSDQDEQRENRAVNDYLNKTAASQLLSRTNYDKLVSTKIDLDADLAKKKLKKLLKMDEMNEAHRHLIEQVKAQGENERETQAAQHKAEMEKQDAANAHIIETMKLANERLRLEKDLEIEGLKAKLEHTQKQTEHESVIRQTEADKTAQRQREQEEWENEQAIEFANRTSIFAPHYVIRGLKKLIDNVLDEIEELEANKADTHKWLTKREMASETLNTYRTQLRSLEAELCKGINGERQGANTPTLSNAASA